jgi:hypothetical protein
MGRGGFGQNTMIILLRISPKSFNKPLPLGIRDKSEAVNLSLSSLVKAGIGKHRVVVISDEWTHGAVPFKYEDWVEKPGVGNEGTFYTQTDIAIRYLDEEVVLYLEDDYLWRPDTLDSLEKACQILGFVSPYDHPAHYLEERFDKRYLTALVDGITYKTSPSNTLTFAAPAKLIKKHSETLKAYGIGDHEMFQKIIAEDNLWNPCYSFATHLVQDCLSPNVDWDMVKYNQQDSKALTPALTS